MAGQRNIRGYGVASPSIKLAPLPIEGNRAPATSDLGYEPGQIWLYAAGDAAYVLIDNNNGSANWEVVGGGSSSVSTLSGDTGTATPVAGNILIAGGAGVVTSASGSTVTVALEGGSVAMDSFIPDAGTNPVVPTALGAVTMAGTANQITTTGGLNTLTFSVPTTFIAPGSIESTTTITAATGLTVTTGDAAVSAGNANVTGNVIAAKSAAAANVTVQATNSDNTSGTSNAGVEIATGGASSGDPYLSFQISGVGASTMTMGLDNSASDTFVISNSATIGTSNALSLTQAGALTTASSITATTGDITSSAGNLVTTASGAGFVTTPVVASGASPQTADGRVFSVTFTGVSIASGASQAFDIANTAIVGGGTIALVQWSGATAGSALSIQSQVPTAGHLTITMTNGTSATMVTSVADITFTGIVLN